MEMRLQTLSAKLKKRIGMTMAEMLGVMIVLAILAVIAIGGISAARDNANITSVISDMRTFENSIRQALMLHPDIMKYNAAKPTGAADLILEYINFQVEDQWEFEPIGSDGGTPNIDSGAIATTTTKRDAWGNAYCLYVYFDSNATTYTNKEGANLVDSDSCVYIVVASPGKNSTGVGLGADGNNYDEATKKLIDPAACVNNTDGVDDIGLIVRIYNGDVYSATFGTDSAVLGSLKGTQWVFGKPSTTGGVIHDFTQDSASTHVNLATITNGGSIDQFYNANALRNVGKATWVGGTAAYSVGS